MTAEERQRRDAFLRNVVETLKPANGPWPGLWTRLDSLLREADAMRAALEPFTAYDLHATQHIAGLAHEGHRLRAVHVEDIDALTRHIANARTALGLGGSTWSGQEGERHCKCGRLLDTNGGHDGGYGAFCG